MKSPKIGQEIEIVVNTYSPNFVMVESYGYTNTYRGKLLAISACSTVWKISNTSVVGSKLPLQREINTRHIIKWSKL